MNTVAREVLIAVALLLAIFVAWHFMFGGCPPAPGGVRPARTAGFSA